MLEWTTMIADDIFDQVVDDAFALPRSEAVSNLESYLLGIFYAIEDGRLDQYMEEEYGVN